MNFKSKTKKTVRKRSEDIPSNKRKEMHSLSRKVATEFKKKKESRRRDTFLCVRYLLIPRMTGHKKAHMIISFTDANNAILENDHTLDRQRF